MEQNALVTGVEIMAAAKTVGPVALKAYRFAQSELSRANLSVPGSLDAVFHEAFEILTSDADGLARKLRASIRGAIARPKLLALPDAKAWIRTADAQEGVRRAAYAVLQGKSPQGEIEKAVALYRAISGEDDDYLAPHVFDEAVAFLLSSVAHSMQVGERAIMQSVMGLHDKVDRLASPAFVDLADTLLGNELVRLRQARFFNSFPRFEAARRLADRILGGELRHASAPKKASALAWCARILATEDDQATVQALIDESRSLAMTEEADLAQAFLTARHDWQAAVSALAPGRGAARATAALQILNRAQGAIAAVNWFEAVGVGLDDLDVEGRYVLLGNLIEADRWDRTQPLIDACSDADFEAVPALRSAVAYVLLATDFPADLRGLLIAGVPFSPKSFPLPETDQALNDRRRAAQLFDELSVFCSANDLAGEARLFAMQALWLRLRDPLSQGDALVELKRRLDDRSHAVSYLPLGLAFGLPIVREEAEKLLTRDAALNPQGSTEAAMARLALILDADNPKEIATEIAKWKSELAEFLDPAGLLSIQIEALVGAREIDQARDVLASIPKDALSPRARDYLEKLVGGGVEGPAPEELEQLYEAAPNTPLLAQIVDRRRMSGYSEAYFQRALELVRVTKSVQFAERNARFLVTSKQMKQADELLGLVPELIPQSPILRTAKAWVDFHLGRIAEADVAVDALRLERTEFDDVRLKRAILTVSGRWRELDGLIEQAWASRGSFDVIDLVEIMDLAATRRSQRTRDLATLVAEMAPDDPRVLIAAYHAAVTAGVEEEIPQAKDWIPRAAELSGSDGPIQSMSLRQILDEQPDWERHTNEVWQNFGAAELPFSIAATALRRTTLELQLWPMLSNSSVADPRQRSLLPLFNAARAPEQRPLNVGDETMGFDPTALVTLEYLGLLDLVIETYAPIKIPHPTLVWIYQDAQRLIFHQPSRVQAASELLHAIEVEREGARVRVFERSVQPTTSLVEDIGVELASLIADADADAEADGRHLVVHPYPITRLHSLMSEEADIGGFARVMCSCSAVVDKLEHLGRLTAERLTKARDYMARVEQRWPDEPVIGDEATLYLSDLAVDYLRYTGTLEPLFRSGLKVVLSSSEVREARQLVDYHRRSDQVQRFVERLRRVLTEAIAGGKVQLDEIRRDAQLPEQSVAVAFLGQTCGALICDDRTINRFESFDKGTGQAAILTTLDILADLRHRKRLDDAAFYAARTSLRQAGAVFLPWSPEELQFQLERARVTDGEIQETAELRAIRENLLLAQQRGWLQPAIEARWLVDLMGAVETTIKAQWSLDIDDSIARARSNWLLQFLDTRDWSASGVTKPSVDLAYIGYAMGLLRLLFPTVEGKAGQRFARWLESEVIEPLEYDQPEVHRWLLGYLRDTILRFNEDLEVDLVS